MSAPGRPYRLLPLAVHSGPLNMAIDEALLLAAESGGTELTLRLYAWEPPALSLGYFQAARPPSSHLPVVRRLTGGGAIVHDAELTYSLVWRFGAGHGLPAGVGESYAFINRGLTAALKRLGLAADASRNGEQRVSSEPFLCFARRSRHDLVVQGNKVVGSAQRRLRTAALQHGSILVGPSQVRGVPDRSLSELVGRSITPDEAAAALVGAFEAELGWTFEPGTLTIDERHLAEGLRHHKYNHLAWGGRTRPGATVQSGERHDR